MKNIFVHKSSKINLKVHKTMNFVHNLATLWSNYIYMVQTRLKDVSCWHGVDGPISSTGRILHTISIFSVSILAQS